RMRFLDVPLGESRILPSLPAIPAPVRGRFVWARNNAPYLGFTVLFFGLNAGLFLHRAYQYRNTNILEMGARACGQCLNLDCVLLLSLILRRSITRLRNSRLGRFFPCDSHVHFHKMAGWAVAAFSILHTIFHLANFVTLSEDTGISVNSYLWDTSLGIGWVGGLANPTGGALLIILAIIVAFSHRVVRKSGYFEIFYWTHLLSLPFWVLLVLHGPRFWMWLLIPGSAFIVEMFLRCTQVCSKRGRTSVIKATTLPSQVVKLRIQRPQEFEFKAGEYIYLNIPSIAKYEWHPFTISSAPEVEDEISVHIRAVGGWTKRLYDMCKEDDSMADLQKCVDNLVICSIGTPVPKLQGILNPVFTSDERSNINLGGHTIIELEDDNDGKGRYVSNLLEFNRKMSVLSKPNLEINRKLSVFSKPAELIVESERKPSIVARKIQRKRSNSLSELPAILAEVEILEQHQQQLDSGHASLTGSDSSLNTIDEENITVANLRKKSLVLNPQKKRTKEKFIEVFVDGPYGSPSTRIFTVPHAVLIGAGIGITPFAAILQSVMHRYCAAKAKCPHCQIESCMALPSTLRKLRKLDFIWVNRDLGSFQWFLELLEKLESEQQVSGAAIEKFLNLHLYKTGPSSLPPSMPLASFIKVGRPDWDKVFQGIRESKAGNVTVFYCGPPTLVDVLRDKCIEYRFTFRREMF
ncbi:unnamed protein product, partial [Meganyctiphanes norvegica]